MIASIFFLEQPVLFVLEGQHPPDLLVLFFHVPLFEQPELKQQEQQAAAHRIQAADDIVDLQHFCIQAEHVHDPHGDHRQGDQTPVFDSEPVLRAAQPPREHKIKEDEQHRRNAHFYEGERDRPYRERCERRTRQTIGFIHAVLHGIRRGGKEERLPPRHGKAKPDEQPTEHKIEQETEGEPPADGQPRRKVSDPIGEREVHRRRRQESQPKELPARVKTGVQQRRSQDLRRNIASKNRRPLKGRAARSRSCTHPRAIAQIFCERPQKGGAAQPRQGKALFPHPHAVRVGSL